MAELAKREWSDWYVVRTKPKSERKAAAELRAAGLHVHLPRRPDVHRNRGTGVEMRRFRPLFVGYLLVRFPPELIDAGVPRFDLVRARPPGGRWVYDQGTARARLVDGGEAVHGAVDRLLTSTTPFGPRPLSLPAATVRDYIHRQRARLYDAAAMAREARDAWRRRFRKGARVRIVDGPFRGFMGKVDHLDRAGAELLVDIFGRATPVHFPELYGAVEPLPLAESRRAA